MITQPIDLIVANTMRDAISAEAKVDILRKMIVKAGLKVDAEQLDADMVARKLLCAIAHDADLHVVHVALAACGAPASADMIREGLQAVRDRQARS